MPPVPFAEFTAKVLSVYSRRRLKTRKKVAQVLGEFAYLCSSTADITPSAITAWLAEWPHRKPVTGFSLLRSFRSACTTGMVLGLLERSPFTGFWSPAEYWPEGALDPPESVPYLTVDQMSRLLAQSDTEALRGSWVAARLRALVHLYVCLGCRASEALGLMVADLDLAGGTVTIRPNPRRPLKNRASRRCLGLPPILAAVLASWTPGSVWLIPHKGLDGPWMSGRPGHKPLDEVSALGRRAGVVPCTIQMCRHGYATAFTGGELALQMQLGHRSASTQRSYRHVDPMMMRSIAERWGL